MCFERNDWFFRLHLECHACDRCGVCSYGNPAAKRPYFSETLLLCHLLFLPYYSWLLFISIISILYFFTIVYLSILSRKLQPCNQLILFSSSKQKWSSSLVISPEASLWKLDRWRNFYISLPPFETLNILLHQLIFSLERLASKVCFSPFSHSRGGSSNVHHNLRNSLLFCHLFTLSIILNHILNKGQRLAVSCKEKKFDKILSNLSSSFFFPIHNERFPIW